MSPIPLKANMWVQISLTKTTSILTEQLKATTPAVEQAKMPLPGDCASASSLCVVAR